MSVFSASERIKPVPTSSPPTRTSSTSSRRSRATQALKGAEKEALGRLMISSGNQARAARFRATFPLRPETLRSPVSEKAALKTMGSTKGTRTSVDAAMLALSVYVRLSPGRNILESARHIRLT